MPNRGRPKGIKKKDVIPMGKRETADDKGVVSKAYRDSIKTYWDGRPNTALEHLSRAIAENPTAKGVCPLYRLWIDILAKKKDDTSLQALNEHLVFRARNDDEREFIYYALAGLALFEGEQIEAASLLYRTISQYDHFYVAELQQKIESRTLFHLTSIPLFQYRGRIGDHVTLTTLAQGLLAVKNYAELRSLLVENRKIFKEDPLPDLFELHLNYEENRIPDALRHAEKLSQRFPANIDFLMTLGCLLIKSHRFTEAMDILQRTLSMSPNETLDIELLLAEASFGEAMGNKSKKSFENASRANQIALKACGTLGLPQSHLLYQKSKIDVALGIDNDELKPSPWLIHCSESSAADLMLMPTDENSTIEISLGKNVKKGDMCFFVKDSYGAEKDSYFRLFAIYRVDLDPQFHPLFSWRNVLEPVIKLNQSVPIEVYQQKSNSDRLGDFKVFSMAENALSSIGDAIADYSGLEEHKNLNFYLGKLG